MSITYIPQGNPNVLATVLLDRKRVGIIKRLPGGYCYRPFGGKDGQKFQSVAELKASIEGLEASHDNR